MMPKYPTTAEEFFGLLCEIWNSIPEDYFIRLSHSTVQRCNAIKNVSGTSSKY